MEAIKFSFDDPTMIAGRHSYVNAGNQRFLSMG
jgi:hypothetical protein